MPNLMKYFPVSGLQVNDVATLDAVEERLTTICDRFDAPNVAAVDTFDRHCSNHELESRLSSSLLDSLWLLSDGFF
jgi:hypothetical protein